MKLRSLYLVALLAAGLLRTVGDELQYSFSTNLPVFDITGSLDTPENPIPGEYSIFLSPRGRISGPFSVTLDDGSVRMELNGSSAGNVFRSRGVLQSNYYIRGRFAASSGNRRMGGSMNLRAHLTPDETGEYLVGRCAFTICAPGQGCRTSRSPFSIPLRGDGETKDDWTLALNLTNGTKRVTGTAVATLANGRTVPFRVTGTGKTSRKLSLIGKGEGAGVLLSVRIDANGSLTYLNGRLFGQRVAFSTKTGMLAIPHD